MISMVTIYLSVTICGDACPLSCVSTEAYKLAQSTRCLWSLFAQICSSSFQQGGVTEEAF